MRFLKGLLVLLAGMNHKKKVIKAIEAEAEAKDLSSYDLSAEH